MYVYSFSKFAGYDRVFQTSVAVGQPGDLLQTTDDFLLHLGQEKTFPELGGSRVAEQDIRVVYPWFFSQPFLSFLHWMVYERYSTYKNVMKYFVSPDLQDLLFREKKALDARKKLLDLVKGQTLIIFPDNWTRYHMLDGVVGVDRSPSCLQLFSTDTQNRKDLNWRTIKKGGASMIVATHSEVFQPFIALKKIILVDSHKWYYHNQQDPRYSLSTVVKKMAEIYGAEVIEVKNVGKLAFEI